MAEPGETTAALRLFGDELDPDEITDLLGCRPTCSHRKGDTILNRKTGKPILDADGLLVGRQTGSWRLRTRWRGPEQLETQIWELLEQVTSDIAVWQRLASSYGGDVFCGWQMECGNDGLFLTPSLLQALGERRLALNLDVYGFDDEEDEG